MKNKAQIITHPDECRVCYICQLVCSLKQDGAFNPSKAHIEISSIVKLSGQLDVGISFTDQCDNCGLCVKYCVYGALSREKLRTTQPNL